MDKPWIKGVLIGSFVVSLLFLFVGAYQALQPPAYAEFTLPAKAPEAPRPLELPTVDYSKPDLVAKQIEQMNLHIQAYGSAVKAYEANVAAYVKDIESRTTAWKAKNGDPAARLTAYEKVVKDTLAFYIVAPLLAALLIYSGIKVNGDVRVASATNTPAAEVRSP